MTEYMLAALDMDGTLLNSAHETTAYTRAVIERAARSGRIITLSTGRALSELWAHLEKIPGIAYVIGESGACIYDVKQCAVIHRTVLKDGDVDAIFAAAADLEVLAQCFVDDQSYLGAGSDEEMRAFHLGDFISVYHAGSRFTEDVAGLCRRSPGRVSKVNLFFIRHEDRERFAGRMRGLNVALKDSIGIGWEISAPGVDKAGGLRYLCDCLHIPIEQVMAVGDGDNDLDIMAVAGLSVAMGNAIPAVRNIARAVTDDCDHDGAAKAIEKYML